MNKKSHLFYTNFDDLQSRIASLSRDLKKEFKRDSITIKKYMNGCYRKFMKQKI